MKPWIIFIAIVLAAGCSGIYEPCMSKDDCDPEVSDGCLDIPGGPPSFCSVVCQEDRDCPEGPNGEAARCILVGKVRACSL